MRGLDWSKNDVKERPGESEGLAVNSETVPVCGATYLLLFYSRG